MNKPIHSFNVKATDKESGEPRHSHNWVRSTRAKFKVYEELITCGSWQFKLDQIQEPIIYKTRQMFIPGSVLTFKYENVIYQFGFNPWVKPEEFIPSASIKKMKMKYSKFSILLRITWIAALVGYLLFIFLN